MNKDYKYRILPEYELIIEKFVGDFNILEIMNSTNLKTLDPDWRENYNVLADFTKTNSIIETNIENNIDEYLEKGRKLIKKHRAAILTSSPDQVVGSTFMKLNMPSQSLVQIEIFSTIERALSWLGISLKEIEKIKRILEQMSND